MNTATEPVERSPRSRTMRDSAGYSTARMTVPSSTCADRWVIREPSAFRLRWHRPSERIWSRAVTGPHPPSTAPAGADRTDGGGAVGVGEPALVIDVRGDGHAV